MYQARPHGQEPECFAWAGYQCFSREAVSPVNVTRGGERVSLEVKHASVLDDHDGDEATLIWLTCQVKWHEKISSPAEVLRG